MITDDWDEMCPGEAIGFWNPRTLKILAEVTGYSEDTLFMLIKQMHRVELSIKTMELAAWKDLQEAYQKQKLGSKVHG